MHNAKCTMQNAQCEAALSDSRTNSVHGAEDADLVGRKALDRYQKVTRMSGPTDVGVDLIHCVTDSDSNL